MKRINLRDLFPEYELDCHIEVPDGDADAFAASITKAEADVYFQCEREETAYLRRLFRNKAHYSLDQCDGIEAAVLYPPLSPADAFERKGKLRQIHAAINSLPDKQAKRIYAHFFLGISKSEIAVAEGIDARNVRASITCGLRNLAMALKNIF